MRYSLYTIFLFLILLLFWFSPVVSATTYSNPNFTPVINTSPGTGTIVNQNQTYTIYDQNYTPLIVYLFVAVIGLFFLMLSFIHYKNTEIFAALAIIPLAFTAWGSLSIDMVLSSGMAGVFIPSTSVNMWVLLENHTIYPSVVLSVIFLILSVVAFIQFIHELLQGRSIEDNDEPPED
jgi:hypothetical protein